MAALAMYRLPNELQATRLVQSEGNPELLASVAELNGKEGFVIAPFAASGECPVLLLHPDRVSQFPIRERMEVPLEETPSTQEEKVHYAHDFACFHDELEKGSFRKIVLARCSRVNAAVSSVEELFVRTCRLYPRLFVALVSTPRSGTWLMATPEVLLCGEDGEFSTMALAGTQKSPEWSEKNREEQQYVTDYIERCVKGFADGYTLNGPYTTMAAHLYHLRTDIHFRLADTSRLGDVLEQLYPTPAVCGIPKEETREFILRNEHRPRKYYSGFVGPVSPLGKTALFVSLRCMNIREGGYCDLYAGGGLLRESEMEKEWAETETKLQTIKKVLILKPDNYVQ